MNSIPTVEKFILFVFYQYYMTMQLLYFDSTFFSLQLPYLVIAFSCGRTHIRTFVINLLTLCFVGEQSSFISSIYEIYTSCYVVLRLLFQEASTAWTTLGDNHCRFYYTYYKSIKDSIFLYRQISCYFHIHWKITGKAKYPMCLPLIRSIIIDLPQRRNQFIVLQCLILYQYKGTVVSAIFVLSTVSKKITIACLCATFIIEIT